MLVKLQKWEYFLHPPFTENDHSRILKEIATDNSKALPILFSYPKNPPSNILEMT
jgi:hypothetical protein